MCVSIHVYSTLAPEIHKLLVIDELLERPLDEDVVGPEDALSAL